MGAFKSKKKKEKEKVEPVSDEPQDSKIKDIPVIGGDVVVSSQDLIGKLDSQESLES